MEPNQEHLVAAAMFGDSQQIIDAIESGFAGEIARDLSEPNRLD